MPLLDVRDLHVSFRTRTGIVRAVDGVSFRLEAGETLALVGESGSGKSATALSILRLVPADRAQVSGEVIFDGHDLLKANDRELLEARGGKVAMIFQDPMTSLNPVLTVGEQVAEPLRLHRGMRKDAAQRRAVELLDAVGIPDAARRARQYPHQYSGGMRQRAMIAMALTCEPKLILADEITTALDVTIQAQILDLLRSLSANLSTAFLLITHDLGIVAGVTQRVHVMYAGQVVEKAETGELFRNPRMPYTWGLLKSLPRVDEPRRSRLVPIEGMPPSLSKPMTGCRFAPRCPFRRQICVDREPDLLPAAMTDPAHEARCWAVQDVPGGGWLRSHDWRSEPSPVIEGTGGPTP